MRIDMRATRALDQIANSASSALFTFGAVFLLSAREFGSVSLQLIAMSLTLGLTRAAMFEAALFARADHQPSEFSWLMPRVGLLSGLLAGSAMVLVGLATQEMPVATTVSVALVGASALLVDGIRYGAITSGRSEAALVVDSVWLVLTLVSLVGIHVINDKISFAALAFAYAISGLASSCIGFLLLRREIHRSERAPFRALRKQSKFGLDFALQILPNQLVLLLAPAIIGLDGLGSYRAVGTLYQPLITAATAVRLAVLGSEGTEGQVESRFSKMLVLLTALSGIYMLLALVLTNLTGILDHGALAGASVALVAIFGLAEVARVGLQPVFDIARLGNRLKVLLQLRVAQAVVLVAGSVALGLVLDIEGFATARLLAYALALVFVRQLRATVPPESP
jgi:hypothetical protein